MALNVSPDLVGTAQPWLRNESARRPVQVFVQKLKRALAVDAVAALKVFDFGSVSQAELRVKPTGLRVLMTYPRINSNAVKMSWCGSN